MIKYLIPILILLSCNPQEKKQIVKIDAQESGTEASFRGLSVVDENIAWASGSKGTVLTTSDGGATWRNISTGLPDTVDFRDIEAFSDQEALIISAGTPGLVFRTTNSGANWDLVYQDDREEIFFDAMGFWDEKSGIAFGDVIDGLIEIIITDDGGESWQQLPEENRPIALDGEGGFAASGTCLITYGDSSVWIALGIPESRVIYSGDRGKTWSYHASPMVQDTGSAGIFSLAFNSDQYGLAIGGDYQNRSSTNKLLAKSNNGGDSWELVEESGLNGQKSAITPILETEEWLATGATGINYSIDNGLTWNLVDSTGYYTIQMGSKNVGFISGPKGRVGKLTINR